MTELAKELVDKVKSSQRWKCADCGISIATKKSHSHIHQMDRDITNVKISNLVALCKKCYEKKTSMQLDKDRKSKDKERQ
jgi:5-methylcytosine-specific restriction endonuclease McrA